MWEVAKRQAQQKALTQKRKQKDAASRGDWKKGKPLEAIQSRAEAEA